MPIRVLAPEVSSKIAAGEVVERPASVVKELVENAVDAGATEVAVEIAGGGIESIRVTDNGGGIPADEIGLAFQRFATSKVASIEDLDAIGTLGFRGEALASIAAVAEVSLVSRPPDAESGARLEMREGVTGRVEPHGAAAGTVVTVRHLFRDFPARRKFLRSPAAESGRIQGMVSRLALAYPEVRWRLVVDGKEALATGGSGDMREAFGEVYDAETARQMLALEPDPEPRTPNPRGQGTGAGVQGWPVCTGLIGPPSVTRANRSYITFFVNRRWVQSRTLAYALEQAYHGFLKEHRYPVAVVNVAVPPEQVDVNVHPAKSEVRFRHEDRVFAAVQQAVRRTLTQYAPVPEATPLPQTPNPTPQTPGSGGLGLGFGETPRPMGVAAFWPTEVLDKTAQPSSPEHRTLHPETQGSGVRVQGSGEPPTPRGTLAVLRVLGQVQNTYVVAEGPDGMYLVDQHAAHERVLFEKVRALARERRPEVQALLEPVVLELDARQQELVDGRLDLLASMGFALEPFGASAYLLRGVPGVMAGEEPRGGFLDVLDLMADGGGFESWEERAAYSVACHSAIRAGKVLTMQEMTELTRLLEACEQPHTCPHGRPTMVHMSASHLEREFGRR